MDAFIQLVCCVAASTGTATPYPGYYRFVQQAKTPKRQLLSLKPHNHPLQCPSISAVGKSMFIKTVRAMACRRKVSDGDLTSSGTCEDKPFASAIRQWPVEARSVCSLDGPPSRPWYVAGHDAARSLRSLSRYPIPCPSSAMSKSVMYHLCWRDLPDLI